MTTDNDRDELERLLAEILPGILANATEAEREKIGQSLAPFFYGRAAALRKPENTYTPQWLWEDQDINHVSPTALQKENVAGHQGPTLPRRINIWGGVQPWLTRDDPQELNIRIAAGAMNADYIVDASGAGTHLTLHGTTGALAEAIASGVSKFIWVCTTHSETVTATQTLTSLATSQKITVASGGRSGGEITYSHNSAAMIITTPSAGSESILRFEHIILGRGTGNNGAFIQVTSGPTLPRIEFVGVDWGAQSDSWEYLIDIGAVGSGVYGGVLMDDCIGKANALTNTSAGGNATGPVRVTNNDMSMAILFARGGSSNAEAGTHYIVLDNKIVFAPIAGYESALSYLLRLCHSTTTPVVIAGNTFTHADDIDFIDIGTAGTVDVRDVVIADNNFTASAAGASFCDISPTGGSPTETGANITIMGNALNGPGSGTAIKVNLNSITDYQILNGYYDWTTNVDGGSTPGFGSGGMIRVEEDNTVVSGFVHTLDFTEPLATVTSLSSGEVDVNLALYLLASGVRPLTGNWVQSGAFGIWTAGSLRVGSSTAPNNTTAGDTTVERLFVGGSGGVLMSNELVNVDGDISIVNNNDFRIYFDDSDTSNFMARINGGSTGDFSTLAQRANPADDDSGWGFKGGSSLITHSASASRTHHLAYFVPEIRVASGQTITSATPSAGAVAGWFYDGDGAHTSLASFMSHPRLSAGSITVYRHFYADLALVSGSTIGTMYGLDIPDMQIAGVTLGVGVRNLGTSRLVGAVTVGADAAATSGQILDVVGDTRIQGMLRVPLTATTIASDQIAVAATTYITLAGQGAAADDLDGITGGVEGDIIIASPVSDSVTITVKHNNAGGSTGAKIFTAGGTDITLDDINDMAIFVYKAALDSGNGGWMASPITSAGAGGAHAMLDGGTAHSDTAADSVSRGSLIYGNSTPAWDELVIGAANKFLKSDGTDAAWGDVLHSNVSTASMKQTLVLTAAGGKPTTTAGCAAAQVIEAGTNDIDYWVLDFDATTTEYAFWNVAMPANWDASTVTYQVIWTTASSTNTHTASFWLQGLSLGDSETRDAAYGTAIEVTDNATATANQVLISAESGAVTLAGTPAAGDYVTFRLSRVPGDSDDDLNVDARVLAVRIKYGITALSA